MLGRGLETAPQRGIESGRFDTLSTERAAAPGRGTQSPGEEANPPQADNMRIATPVPRGPSRDHRRNAGSQELPLQNSPENENCSGPATCRTPEGRANTQSGWPPPARTL